MQQTRSNAKPTVQVVSPPKPAPLKYKSVDFYSSIDISADPRLLSNDLKSVAEPDATSYSAKVSTIAAIGQFFKKMPRRVYTLITNPSIMTLIFLALLGIIGSSTSLLMDFTIARLVDGVLCFVV